jgi:hypothetical protein
LQTLSIDGHVNGMESNKETSIYDAVSGGADLVRWFGQVPSFHDAEILGLDLRRDGPSVLRLHGWINTGEVGKDGYFVLDRHAIVTFTMSGIMDLQLDGFSSTPLRMASRTLMKSTFRRTRGRFIPTPWLSKCQQDMQRRTSASHAFRRAPDRSIGTLFQGACSQ